ncbi:MAG TPA: copper oxidase [Kofleriaceae bacterium]|nr:copper oxidase [Kofleriaceae bacterium]
MTITRRSLLGTGLAAGAIAVARRAGAQPHEHQHGAPAKPAPPATPAGKIIPAPPVASAPVVAIPKPPAGERYTPVIVPNGHTLPFKKQGGVKVFHLVAGPVKHQFAPGLEVEAWGYNGTTPGPLIEAVVGDRVRIYVTNKLPEPTTVHWHGMFVPNGMDGVGGLTQDNIKPGTTFKYEFTLEKPGTFMYHPHFDEMTQIALGMVGMFVVHPKQPEGRRVRDFSLMAHEWKVPIGAARPDPLAMNDFNVLTFNSKAFPGTAPLAVEVGDLVRIRLGNLGPMDHHPIHLHGYAFHVVETDGGRVPPGARWPETTVLVPVGSVRVIEFVADTPGDWALHCHMTHHVMNQMGHDAPNLIGTDVKGIDDKVGKLVPGYMTMGETGMGDMMTMKQPRNSISMMGGKGPFDQIDMGGMFTIVKVRKQLTADNAAGWYEHPAGTVADVASDADLARDGIKI